MTLAWGVVAACSASPRGSVHVEFIVPQGAAIADAFLFARVEARPDDPLAPGAVLVEATPRRFAAGRPFEMPPIPNGDHRVLVAELRDGLDGDDPVVLYGQSRPFLLTAGQSETVEALVELRSPPRINEESIWVETETPGLVRTSTVQLRLQPDTGVEVELSPSIEFPPQYTTSLSIESLEAVASARIPVRRVLWNLDRGAAEPCGPHDQCARRVHARFTDSLGYVSRVASTEVALDQRPPGLVAAASRVELIAPRGSRLRTVTALTTGSALRVEFTTDEPVGAAPMVYADGPVTFPLARETGEISSFTYTTTVTSSVLDGTYHVMVAIRDRAGNEATVVVEAPPVIVDNVPPEQPSTRGPAALRYERSPWGTHATSGAPSFVVNGTVESHATVFVFDRPGGLELGRAPADPAGRFALALPTDGLDRNRLYVVDVDHAGNESTATRVEQTTWTATLIGKVPGSARENPHRVGVTPRTVSSLVQLPVAAIDPSSTELAALSAADGSTLDSSAWWHWRDTLSATGPLMQSLPLAVYSPELGRVLAYDPMAARLYEWTGEALIEVPAGPMLPSGRQGSAMAYDPINGDVVLFGGKGATPMNDLWARDPEGWREHHTAPPLPAARCYHALATDTARGRVVLFGGGAEGEVFADTWQWDGSAWTDATPAGISPSARSGAAVAFDEARGVTVLFGGLSPRGELLDDTWHWDGAAWREVNINGPRPPGRGGAGMIYDSDRRRIVIFAGQGGPRTPLSDVWEWDGQRWAEVSAQAPPPPRAGPGVAFDRSEGQLILIGGIDAGRPMSDIWSWDGQRWRDRLPQSNRYEPRSMALLNVTYDAAREAVVLVGIIDAQFNGLPFTMLWRDGVWSLAPGNPPPARFWAATAFDGARGQVLLFGGIGRTLLGDTWAWDGTDWRSVDSPSAPSPRESSGITDDPGRGRVVLFGGTTATEISGETWVLEGGTWSSPQIRGGPPGRCCSRLARDRRRDRIVMFGGSNLTSTTLDDLWELEADTWRRQSPTGPGPQARSAHAMAYHPEAEGVVLHGGLAAAGPVSDAWLWDGGAWTLLSPGDNLHAGHGHAMMHDGRRMLAAAGERTSPGSFLRTIVPSTGAQPGVVAQGNRI